MASIPAAHILYQPHKDPRFIYELFSRSPSTCWNHSTCLCLPSPMNYTLFVLFSLYRTCHYRKYSSSENSIDNRVIRQRVTRFLALFSRNQTFLYWTFPLPTTVSCENWLELLISCVCTFLQTMIIRYKWYVYVRINVKDNLTDTEIQATPKHFRNVFF